MASAMNTIDDYTFTSLNSVNDSGSEPMQEKYNLDNFYHAPLPYHIQAQCEWMNSPSDSVASTPENPPSTPSPHLQSASPSNASNAFPAHWPTGPTSSSDSPQSIKEIQRLTDAKSRRRQQNRESQRAFRERKNRHIEQLEQALADLQHRHEKLLQCFVGLTAKVSSPNLGAGGVMGPGMGFLDETQLQMPRVQFSAYAGNARYPAHMEKRGEGIC